MSCGVTSAMAFFRSVFARDRHVALPDGGHLALLELGLGEDLAVHLHDDLLEDLGAQRHGGDGEHHGETGERAERLQHC